jgi:hypothetical protein
MQFSHCDLFLLEGKLMRKCLYPRNVSIQPLELWHCSVLLMSECSYLSFPKDYNFSEVAKGMRKVIVFPYMTNP